MRVTVKRFIEQATWEELHWLSVEVWSRIHQKLSCESDLIACTDHTGFDSPTCSDPREIFDEQAAHGLYVIQPGDVPAGPGIREPAPPGT